MKIEHFALNVADPVKMAVWYETHLGLKVVKKQSEPPYTYFLADSSGNVMIEIYNNPPNDVPAYGAMHPLQLHLAFVSENPGEDLKRLESAGATLFEELYFEDGTHLVMMRDPWGFAIQFCKRGKPMLKNQQ